MSISLNIREWCGIHCGGFIGKDDCNELRAIADRIDREVAEYESMKKEVDELRDELDDWKGNAEGFQPDAYMELPLDADGVPIRLKDWVWYVGIDAEITKDVPQQVVGFVSDLGMNGIYAVTRDYPDKAISPKMLTHRAPEPPDSWAKLEEDANKTICNYASAPLDENGLTMCDGCRFYKSKSCRKEMTLDILKRAKKLAGIANDIEGRYL